jgi:peptide/nickel transport system permease protein
MIKLVLRRGLEGLVTLILATFVVFVVGRLTGDPAQLFAPLESTSGIQISRIRQELGLDQPWWQQYFLFVSHAIRGDFGTSFATKQPVAVAIQQRFWPSLVLAVSSIGVAFLIGGPLGVVAATRRGSVIDTAARVFALVGQAVPSFVLALILIAVLAIRWQIFPSSGAETWQSYVLPSVTMGWLISSGVVRLLRSSMIEALESDYVKFARSFGMKESHIVWRWALRNALIPVTAFMGFMFSIIIAGAVSVEVIFAWPGLGQLSYQAVLARDFPTMQAVVVVWSSLVVGASVLTDVAYGFLDPRTRS